MPNSRGGSIRSPYAHRHEAERKVGANRKHYVRKYITRERDDGKWEIVANGRVCSVHTTCYGAEYRARDLNAMIGGLETEATTDD